MKVVLDIVGDGVPSASSFPSLSINTERFEGGCINVAFSFTVQVSVTVVPSVIGLAGSLVMLTDKIDRSACKGNSYNFSKHMSIPIDQ